MTHGYRTLPHRLSLCVLLLAAAGCTDTTGEDGATDTGDTAVGSTADRTTGDTPVPGNEDTGTADTEDTGPRDSATTPIPDTLSPSSDTASDGDTALPSDTGTEPPATDTTPAPVDECNSTAECQALWGPQATDCVNAHSDRSWCACGAVPCSAVDTTPQDTATQDTADTGLPQDTDTPVDTGVVDTDPGTITAGDPSVLPPPPTGQRWVLQPLFSDEFNGSSLDTDKWLDYHKSGWKGRPPAKFVPYAVSVENGFLKIHNGILDQPDGPYTYYGGAVTSRREEAHFGYYETKMIASKTRMSSTFWLSNSKQPFTPTSCTSDRYSQELDIQESIGNPGPKGESMGYNMSSNTHFRYVACGASTEKFYTKTPPKVPLSTPVADAFHVYAAWWKDDKHVTFYADNAEGPTQYFSTEISQTPFDRPMYLCMVTETYDWTSPVIEADLLDPDRNATYYDWVRSWKLVPVDQHQPLWDYDTPVLTESVSVRDHETRVAQEGALSLVVDYQANAHRVVRVTVTAGSTVVGTATADAYQGAGALPVSVPISAPIASGDTLTVTVHLQKNDRAAVAPIDRASFTATAS